MPQAKASNSKLQLFSSQISLIPKQQLPNKKKIKYNNNVKIIHN